MPRRPALCKRRMRRESGPRCHIPKAGQPSDPHCSPGFPLWRSRPGLLSRTGSDVPVGFELRPDIGALPALRRRWPNLLLSIQLHLQQWPPVQGVVRPRAMSVAVPMPAGAHLRQARPALLRGRTLRRGKLLQQQQHLSDLCPNLQVRQPVLWSLAGLRHRLHLQRLWIAGPALLQGRQQVPGGHSRLRQNKHLYRLRSHF
jgi:hypothetical protein